LLPVVFRAVVFKLLVWCGAEGYVSGLQDAAASCILQTWFVWIVTGSSVDECSYWFKFLHGM